MFSSVSFLFYFLPVVLIIYYLVPKNGKNFVLLLFSLFFYFCGEQFLVWIMLFSSLLNYTASRWIESHRGNKLQMRVGLFVSLIGNLGLLGYFKYTDFFIANINGIFGTSIPLLKIALPIGISFYTFQTMSYTLDVYRGEVKAQRNFFHLATYVTLFPQLIAGPIVRYQTVSDEIDTRKHTLEDFSSGVRRFVFGLGKKVLLANNLAELGQTFLYSDERSVLFYWLYAIAFSFQVYFDFSGYSDMAIGLGRMFGFHFLENFNYPYIAKTVAEFWRRWHISLGSWFRDYVYIPMGGNRVPFAKWIRNILVVWFLTGFWHGAEWNFVIWGLYFAVFLVLEKLFLSKILAKLPAAISHIYTLFVVLFGFVLFNANNLSEALVNLGGLFGHGGIALSGAESLYYLRSYLPLFVICALASTPLFAGAMKKIASNLRFEKILFVLEPLYLAALFLLVVGFLVDGSFNPFIYFRF